VCGLIAGRDGRPARLYRTTNNDPNPRVRYNVEPLELLNILRDIEDKGWQLLAIYHSHPANEAYPSHTDVSLAYYPDAVYIIVSLAGEDPPPIKAFRIVDSKVREIDLVIDQEAEQREIVS
jgi:[CysO sulfur-carrier protein]-S-L-cysteine hydrolase